VHSDDAVARCAGFAREHGLLVGPSSGANMVAARRLRDELPASSLVVSILCDEGEKYLSEYFIPPCPARVIVDLRTSVSTTTV